MFEAQIQAGAKLLDRQVGKHWAEEIDTDSLDMHSCFRCVVGQLFGNYWEGIDSLWDNSGYDDSNCDFSAVHGFNTANWTNQDTYELLTEEWRAFIKAKQEGGGTN